MTSRVIAGGVSSLMTSTPSDSHDACDAHHAVRAKVATIFSELAGKRANLPSQGLPMIQTMLPVLTSEFSAETAYDIGFHLSDWIEDAAFLVALHLFPERFTREEIDSGIRGALYHIPNHTAAAAALYGVPVEDIFGVLKAN